MKVSRRRDHTLFQDGADPATVNSTKILGSIVEYFEDFQDVILQGVPEALIEKASKIRPNPKPFPTPFPVR